MESHYISMDCLNGSCEHVIAYKKENGVDTYEIIYAFYVAGLAKDSMKRKTECKCNALCTSTGKECEKRQRIHACLFCPFFGCHQEKHSLEHANKTGHVLAMDVTFGNVYCFKCKDYQYDADFDDIAREKNIHAAKKKGEELWELGVQEAKLQKHIILDGESIRGVRAIVNLGNICYMNVILLSLVHAPVFRDCFLSLRHKCSIPANSENQDTKTQKSIPVCFVCEMSNIVQACYNGSLDPFSPARLLYLVYLHEKKFTKEHHIGQCAHEFFIFLLSALRLDHPGSNHLFHNDSGNCIVDTIFSGSLLSEFTCEECKWHSVAQNPFTILYLWSDASPSADDASSSQSQLFEKIFKKNSVSKKCDKCNKDDQQHSEIITLKKLPLVLCFNLQRKDEKLPTEFIGFPEYIDLAPFMSQCNSETVKENHRNGSNKSNFRYYLFAVVNHKSGENKELNQQSKDGGHYKVYVKRFKTWFLVNNNIVEVESLETVLKTKWFMLFYHKETLDYKDKINLMKNIR